MEERCAPWLLQTHDRVRSDAFPLTHALLAQMRGVRRATVTVAAGLLQQAGLIRYSRGVVTIVDVRRQSACATLTLKVPPNVRVFVPETSECVRRSTRNVCLWISVGVS